MRRFLPLILCLTVMLAMLPSEADAFGVGAKGPDVYAVQGMLKSLGYYAGPIDGLYGKVTASGVRQFQKKYGLPQTGAVDGKTLQSILWAYGELKIPRESTPAPQPTPVPPDQTGLEAEEQQMLELINAERVKAGLKPLAVDLPLARVAEIKSRDMVDNNYFSHESPTYGSPFEMMDQFGIRYRSAGENIACNRSVEAAHKALMESKGHRENILGSQFTHIGIGIVDGGPCGMMFTQQFIGK